MRERDSILIDFDFRTSEFIVTDLPCLSVRILRSAESRRLRVASFLEQGFRHRLDRSVEESRLEAAERCDRAPLLRELIICILLEQTDRHVEMRRHGATCRVGCGPLDGIDNA